MRQGDSEVFMHGFYRAVRATAACFALVMTLSVGLCANAFGTDGTILWQYNDSQAGVQEARASAVDSLGNVIVTGYQNVAGNDDYWTVKFKADGSGVAWRAVYDKVGGGDQATAVVVDHNDDVIVSGYAWNGSNRDIHTIKYKGSDGSVIWQHTFNGAANGNDMATAIAVDSLNNVYVGGSSQGSSATDDYIIIKYAATGPVNNAPLWQSACNGPANGMDNLHGLTAGVDGIAVTGQSYNGTAFDMLTVKYDFNGTKLWEKRYSSAGGAMGKKAGMDGSGNVIVTGFGADASSKNIYIAKYRGSDGALLWEQGKVTGFDEEANDLFVESSGDVFITGYVYTVSGTKKRAYTARYSGSNGSLVWESVSNMASDSDEGTGIVVDSAGDVYITGNAISSSNYDFMTIKYKRDNGTELWNHRFNGSANLNDRPVGIGLSSAGEVLVAGWSDPGGTNYDYMVMKLDPQLVSAPSNLGATTLSSGSIRLAWTDNAGNEDGFKVERKLGESGTYAQIAQLPANTTTYDDLGLSANITYYYRIRAFNSTIGDSHYSNEAHSLTVYFTSVSPAWTYLYNNPDNQNDKITAIAMGPDNNPVVTGYTQRNAGGHNYLTIKLDRSNKNVIWSWEYDDPNGGTDEAMCVAVDSGNTTTVSGYATLYNAQTQADIFSINTLMYPASGPPETWESQYNGPGNIDDRPVAIASATDNSNNTVVVGYGRNGSGNTDIYVIKYNSASGKVWAASPFDGPGHGNDIPSAAAFGPDGSVYVTGYSEKTPGSGIYSFITAKYSGVNGALIWSNAYSVMPSGDNRGNAIAVDSLGDVYVTGTATNSAGNKDIYTIKYSGSAGTAQRIWERSVDGQAHGDDTGMSIGIDTYDGNIIVAGTSLTGAGNNDFTLVRYTPAGDVLWQTTLFRPNNDDTLKGMAIDLSGTIYLAGDTSNGSSVDMLSAMVDPSGTVLATSVYNGPGNDADEASAIVANEKGEAFVAGYATNVSGNMDYAVLKLISTNYIVTIPTRLAATPQPDSSRIGLSWTNNYTGAAYYVERTTGPVTAGSTWTLAGTTGAGATSYTDAGLNPITTYCYRIKAFSGSATSRTTFPVCTTTTPAQPVLNQPAIVSATAIDLSWGNVAGNTGYKLERSLDNATWLQAGSNLAANATVYHDTGLSSGTSYCYRVAALGNSGASLASQVQIVPGLSATTATASAINLAWPALSGITGYKLERSADGTTGWSQIAAPAQTATAYADTGLSPGGTYYYRIKVVSASGDSIPSAVMSFTTQPATPTLNAVTAASASQINLSWTAAAGATGYNVWESQCNWRHFSGYYDATNRWVSVAVSPNNCDTYPQYGIWSTSVPVGATTGNGSTSYSRTGVGGNTYNRYYIVATTSGSVSAASNTLKAWTPIAQPSLTAVATSDTAISLNWNGGTTCTGMIVERSPDGSTGWTTVTPSYYNSTYYCTSSYTDSGLSASTTYYYRVTVNGVVAPPGVSSVVSATTRPLGPAITSVTLSGNQITVNWSNLAGNNGYEVQRGYSSESTPANWYYWTTVSTTIAKDGTTYTDNSIGAGYAYKYKVRAKFADGSYSGWGSDSGLWKRTAPPTPNSFYANGTSVSWNTAAGATQYYYQSKNPTGGDCTTGTWSSSTATSSTSATIANATTTASCYQVQASNESGNSGWSPAALYLPPPGSFTLGTATVSSIPLSWGNVTGNNGYKIEGYWPNNSSYWNGSSYVYSSQWLVVANTAKDATSLTLNGLVSNTTYQYRISTNYVSNGSFGGSSVPVTSSPASKATLALGSMVLSSLTVDSYAQITIRWSDVAGNNGYKIQRSPDNVTWTDLAITAAGATSYSDTGLASGTKYYYRGQARDGAGVYTAVSNVLSGTTPLTTPVLASVNSISEARIDMSWQVVPSATNYKVLRSVGPNGPWTQIANPSVGYATLYCGQYATATMDCPTLVPVYTAYSNTGLTEGTNYCYQVKANNATVGDSAPSAVVCATTLSVGGPNLTSVVTVASKRMIQLGWSYSPAVCTPNPCASTPDGFEVWRQAWNGQWVLLSKTSNSTFSFADRINIEPQKPYNYRIRAFQGANTSVYSNIMGVTTPLFGPADNSCP